MGELGELATTLARIVTDGGPSGPRRIGDACVAALPVDGASITVMAAADRREPIWASDTVAGRLGQLQFDLGEGPCVEAFTSGHPVLVADLTEGHRWPMFAAGALRTPARAVYSLPLQAGAIAIGVLDLYRHTTGMLDPAQLAGALRSADAALWTLLGLRAGDPPRSPATRTADALGWLDGSPLRHTEVYQATGMVMAQLGVSPEVALSRLRAYAFGRDRTIDEVAREVVARRLRFDEEDWNE